MKTKGFYAYTEHGPLVGPTIESGVAEFNGRTRDAQVVTWKEMDIAGKFIATQVLASIATSDFLVADISKLNFNVTFEVGYGIGLGKPVMLTRMGAMGAVGGGGVDEVGIFDTIGYQTYNNRDDIRSLLQAPLPRRRCYQSTLSATTALLSTFSTRNSKLTTLRA